MNLYHMQKKQVKVWAKPHLRPCLNRPGATGTFHLDRIFVFVFVSHTPAPGFFCVTALILSVAYILLPKATKQFTLNAIKRSTPSATEQFTPNAPEQFTPNPTKQFTLSATNWFIPSATKQFTPSAMERFTPSDTEQFTPNATERFTPSATEWFTPNSSSLLSFYF